METENLLGREKGIPAEHVFVTEESSSSGNAGIFLLSTLWNQSGTIYVDTGSGQTALTGYTYNKYCPLVSVGSSDRSVTGCTNTADSQVIYYWLEKGASLNLEVSSDDYFILKSDSETYFLSNVSQVGEGTITQLNQALSVANPLENGNFIAALNFYCGVKNHSKYGSSTSTGWSYGSYYTGVCASAYRSAGFDSHFFVSRKGSDSACAMFFDETSGLTDVGFSVLRENLDYGEVIRVGIPGHAIVMDGYRYNDETEEYEYHLNFGWGIYSSSTRWYTVSDLNDDSEAYVSYVTVDISPDITVRVSSDRGDYYGGSFLRGVERINHIVSGKEMTTFTFDKALAGKAITLSSSVDLTSGVGVKFTNLCTALSTTAGALLSSKAMMSFSLKNGSMAVNSTSADYVVRETGSSAVTLSLNSSYVYSGYYSAGVSKLDSLLKNDSIYAYSNYADAFYNTVSGRAVIGGSAADTVILSNGSAIFGDLDLGGGTNKLTIENGSLYYGSFTGSAKTLNVNLSIKSAAYDGPMIVLRDSASDADFYSASSGRLNLSLNSLSIGTYSFGLYSGCDAEIVKNFSVKVSYNGESHLLSYGSRSSGMFSLDYSETSLNFSYTLKRLAAPSVNPSTTSVTNKNITLTATYSAGTVTKQYSTDNKTWKTYSSAVSVSANGTYYFRGMDASGNPSAVTSCKVTNIDKTAPDKPVVTASRIEPTNKNVTLMASFSADSAKKQYSTDNATWKTYSSAISVPSNATYYFRGIDAAGNVSSVASYKVTNIDKTAPSKPKVTVSTKAVTNQNVTLTATYSADSVKQQYSLDNSKWKSYKAAGVTLKQNGTVYFRGIDAAGNISSVRGYSVTNIDKTAPGKPTLASVSTTAMTNGSVTVKADFSSDSAKKQYSLDKTTWKSYKSSGVTLKSNGTVYFRSIDAAGNISKVLSQKVSNICPKGDFTNDTVAAAEAKDALKLSSAQKITGWVGLGDPKDFIKLEVQKKGQVSLDMNAATAKAQKGGELKLSLLNSAGKAVTLSALDSDTLATKSKVAAGIYYLGVRCADVNKYSTSYTVTAGMLAG